MGKKFIDFFHVSEHVDHFKAIKVFSLRKKPEIVWSAEVEIMVDPGILAPRKFLG